MELIGGFTALQIAVALAAALGASFVRGLTGFGMAILLVPILALALPPVEAVVLGNCLSLLIGLTEVRMLVREAERSAWVIGAAVVLTTPLGLWALFSTTADVARLVIALIACSAFAAILLPRRPGAMPGRWMTGLVGAASGLMTGYAGMPGPPVVPYYAGRDLPRATIKASMLLVFTIAAATGLAAAAAMGLLRGRVDAVRGGAAAGHPARQPAGHGGVGPDRRCGLADGGRAAAGRRRGGSGDPAVLRRFPTRWPRCGTRQSPRGQNGSDLSARISARAVAVTTMVRRIASCRSAIMSRLVRARARVLSIPEIVARKP